ncbi:FxsA family protein [Corynebacterium timonense]|uniref:UPF0716 protein FxsA n=1 Tax=Corynebacterium timonense TaxID=441500 RepID=A0A1H1P8S9_9CORY|nr:FxsA family protein [Corynebacterium timonense]SDS07597.1 UPF0716 protein FxsA [Corynebacterium timonense]
MRLLLFAYFVVEVLAFIGVSSQIGLGWAFLAVFALSVFGGLGANIALRNSLRRAAGGQGSLGRLAGDGALLAVGWLLCILPGFVSSAVGLIMVFPPTRALLRRALTASATKAMEDFSVRVYSASPVAQYRTSYGTFTTPPTESSQPSQSSQPEVDVEKLEEWFRADSATDDDRRRGRDNGPEGTS